MLKPLKGHNAFGSHFPGGKRFFGDDMMLSLRLGNSGNTQSETKILYFGVSAKKKSCPKAVVRNRIKRLLRELMRQIASGESPAISPEILLRWESVLLIWNKRIEKPGLIEFQDVYKAAKPLFDQAIRYTNKLSGQSGPNT